MKIVIATALSALTLLAIPASAQTMSTMLPSLTWPEGEITTSTKGCAPETVCTVVVPVQE